MERKFICSDCKKELTLCIDNINQDVGDVVYDYELGTYNNYNAFYCDDCWEKRKQKPKD